MKRPGFTLIEVLLALAILAIGVALIVTVSTRALSSVGTAEQHSVAAELAQRKMAELVQAGGIKDPEESPWTPMDTSDLALHPQWRKRISLASPIGSQALTPDPVEALRLLEVTVRLEEDPEAASFRLSTFLPPPAPAAP